MEGGYYMINLIKDNFVLMVSDVNILVGIESEMEKKLLCFVL